MKCKVVIREWLNDVEFYFYEENDRQIYVAKPVEFIFEKHEQGAAVDPEKATFTLGYGKAIELVESLLTEARFSMLGSAQRMRKDDLLEGGELKATKEHLRDMQKLVFEPPKHLAPMVIGNATSGISMLAGIREPDEVVVKASRVRTAARSCGTAAEILKEIFPELFLSGWQDR